jgi:hypothetical protein
MRTSSMRFTSNVSNHDGEIQAAEAWMLNVLRDNNKIGSKDFFILPCFIAKVCFSFQSGKFMCAKVPIFKLFSMLRF